MAAALVGKDAPDFKMTNVGDGKETTLAEVLKEGKPVVVDFYTSW